MYLINKGHSVMLHHKKKAFHTRVSPFALLHIDTTLKSREIYVRRAWTAAESGMELIIHTDAGG